VLRVGRVSVAIRGYQSKVDSCSEQSFSRWSRRRFAALSRFRQSQRLGLHLPRNYRLTISANFLDFDHIFNVTPKDYAAHCADLPSIISTGLVVAGGLRERLQCCRRMKACQTVGHSIGHTWQQRKGQSLETRCVESLLVVYPLIDAKRQFLYP
jgi:hypothetical protein